MATKIFNDNIQLYANKALDNRTGQYQNATWVGYPSTAIANAALNPAVRHQGLTVLIGNTEYWYKEGILDVHLITKTIAISANNGLNVFTNGNIQLGGTLLKSTTIDTTSLYTLTVAGANTGGNVTFQGINTSTGSAIYGDAISGDGISGKSTSGVGVSARSISGIGLNVSSTTSFAGIFNIRPASTGTVDTIIHLQRDSSGTVTNGIGVKLDFSIKSSDGTLGSANHIVSKWTNVTTASAISQFEIWGANNGFLSRKLALKGLGGLTLDAYGLGNIIGTVAYTLGVDIEGNVIETTAPATFTEVDTLQSVTNRGFVTTNAVVAGSLESRTGTTTIGSIGNVTSGLGPIFGAITLRPAPDMSVAGGGGQGVSTIWIKSDFRVYYNTSGNVQKAFAFLDDLDKPSIRTFASDAAADADATLLSGTLYKITGNRTIFQKP